MRPRFLAAVMEDARVFSLRKQEPGRVTGRIQRWQRVLRLLWAGDEFLSLFLYRMRTSLKDAGIPILPRLLYYANSYLYGVRIGDYVVIAPGLYLPHGQTVIDGIVQIGKNCMIFPFTSVGVKAGNYSGPIIEDGVRIGTGSRILGDFTVGAGAYIGANAVVLQSVPAGATAVGVPARIIERSDGAKA